MTCFFFACDRKIAIPSVDNLSVLDGFEEKGENGLSENWRIIPAYEGKGEASMDHDNVQTGNYSLKLKPNHKNTSAAFGVFRLLNADAVKGKKITISGFTKVDGIGDNRAGILFKTDRDDWLLFPQDTGGKFVPFSKTVSVAESIPEANMLLLISGTKGSVWFDDLKVQEVGGQLESDAGRSSQAKGMGDVKYIKEPGRLGELPKTAAILFVSNRDTGSRRTEIYSMDADGKNITRLTFTKEHHFLVAMDRSRQYIVASRVVEDTAPPSGLSDEDRKSIWLLDLKNKEEFRLTDLRNHAEGRSFSPDSEWIVFLMKKDDKGQVDIYKIRRDGSGLKNLTNTPFATEGDPAWSLDGKTIAFTYLDADSKRFLLKKMDVNGGNVKTVYDGGPGPSNRVFPAGNYDPAWSPDNQWLVFERAVKSGKENWGSGFWHIFKVRRDGSEIKDLSLAGGHADRAEYLPSFSPDGNSIVFGSLFEAKNPQQSHNDIFIMDGNGSVLKRLTFDTSESHNMFPIWIP
jgi:Tol biopolymer transport system component